jgi:hypothetical protein
MVQHLCKTFLTDPAEYESAREKWRRLWETLVAAEKFGGEWQVPWFASEFVNGTPWDRSALSKKTFRHGISLTRPISRRRDLRDNAARA